MRSESPPSKSSGTSRFADTLRREQRDLGIEDGAGAEVGGLMRQYTASIAHKSLAQRSARRVLECGCEERAAALVWARGVCGVSAVECLMTAFHSGLLFHRRIGQLSEMEDPPLRLDWPHAPMHRLSESGGTYMVTCATYKKEHFFHSPGRLDRLLATLFAEAQAFEWQLQAWAVFPNHYHFVGASGNSRTLREFVKRVHSATALWLNRMDATPGRRVWFNYWESAITYDTSYFARLNYVHSNPVKHGLVPVANQYRWCSADWLERASSTAQVTKIYRFKTERLNVPDDF
jgi:putative transposase